MTHHQQGESTEETLQNIMDVYDCDTPSELLEFILAQQALSMAFGTDKEREAFDQMFALYEKYNKSDHTQCQLLKKVAQSRKKPH